MTSLSVYYEQRNVGSIEVTEAGPSFVYNPGWLGTRGAFPLSFTMPLSTRLVPPGVFEPWAAGLLPEAENLRVIGRRLGASPSDVIGILAQIGRDTAGALSIGRPGNPDAGNWRAVETQGDLERIIEELPRKPFLVGEDGVSMSLAGVQNKMSVGVDDLGRICIPINGAPSTHILKPDSDRLFGSVMNEAMCLVLARHCGLSVPDVTTGRAGKRHYLLVSRYDRLHQKGRWRRLHQEDFCQALGKPPSAKYESSASGVRGPTLADMFALTRGAMAAPDLLRLIDALIFNILACNTDAHAKNYSLMISGRGFSLAPLYDVMCASVWEGVTRNLAQKVAGKSRGEHLKRRHWQRFAVECSLNAPRLLARIGELADLVEARAGQAADEVAAMPAGGHDILAMCTNEIQARARAIRHGLADMDGASDAPGVRKSKAKPKEAETTSPGTEAKPAKVPRSRTKPDTVKTVKSD